MADRIHTGKNQQNTRLSHRAVILVVKELKITELEVTGEEVTNPEVIEQAEPGKESRN
jgi:hypothetical protein